MAVHLYVSLIPESLVASMLPPLEFGCYLATGTRKRPHGEAMFFQVNEGFRSEYFDLTDIERRCVPHPDGQPKHTVYVAVYRVLEHVPLEALGSLYLATAHGRVLELKAGEAPAQPAGRYHLYQELCPVHPLIASTLGPAEFCKFITDPGGAIFVPRICFVELELGPLADDPRAGPTAGLPYHNVEHIRDCLTELGPQSGKQTKTVDRIGRQAVLYRSVKTGFYVGDQQGMLYYPFPARDELEGKYYSWWRCANDAEVARAGLSV